MFRRPAILAALPAALALVLSACGASGTSGAGSDAGAGAATTTAAAAPVGAAPAASATTVAAVGGDPAAAALLQKAAASTTASATARVALAVKLDVAGVPNAPAKPFALAGEGELDLKGGKAHLTLDASQLAGALGGQQSLPPTMEIISDGTASYLKVPAAAAAKAGGKQWVRLDEVSTSGGAGLGSLGQLTELSNPSAAFGMLQGATGVAKVGTEELRGSAVTRYQVTLGAPPATGSGADSSGLLAMLGGMGGPTPADVWIDDAGRVRKVSFTFDLGALLKGFMSSDSSSSTAAPVDMRFAMSTSVEMWDFDAAITITPPAAADVADAAAAAAIFGS